MDEMQQCGKCGDYHPNCDRLGYCPAEEPDGRPEEDTDTTTCECGQPGTEVCFRCGSSGEIWFCGARKHTARIRGLAAQGWMSQSATVAASPTGIAIRRRMQAGS